MGGFLQHCSIGKLHIAMESIRIDGTRALWPTKGDTHAAMNYSAAFIVICTEAKCGPHHPSTHKWFIGVDRGPLTKLNGLAKGSWGSLRPCQRRRHPECNRFEKKFSPFFPLPRLPGGPAFCSEVGSVCERLQGRAEQPRCCQVFWGNVHLQVVPEVRM